MDKLLRSRLFRCLVCLVLVCCILVNISPLKAESIEIAAASVPFFGMVLWYMFMSSGVVFEPTSDVLNKLNKTGQVIVGDAIHHLEDAQALAAEDEFRRSVVDRMYFSNDPDFPEDSEDDYDDGYTEDQVPDWGIKSGENHNLILGASLGAVLAEWVYDVIMDNQVEVEEEVTAEEGLLYYNDVLMRKRVHLDLYPYEMLDYTGDALRFVWSPVPFKRYEKSDDVYFMSETVETCYQSYSYDGGLTWSSVKTTLFGGTNQRLRNLTWSNYDITDGENIIFSGSEPSSTSSTTVPVLPDTYFGEIPDQVKAGNYDASNIQFPDYNISDSIVSEQAAQQQMQDIYNQVVNNQMSYEDFMEQVQALPSPGIDTDPTPSEPSGETTPDVTQPEEDDTTAQKKFAIDLSDFFPFCIPKDIGAFLAALIATPVAPKFHWVLQDLSGRSYNIDIDLSPWDGYAKLFRDLQVALFILGLALKTKDLIQW